MTCWYVRWLRAIVAEASACRDAFDLAEYTRAIWYQVVIGGEVLPDKWKEEHDFRLQELVRLLAKDASVPEDRRTALTVGSLRERTRNVQDASVMQIDLGQKDWWLV